MFNPGFAAGRKIASWRQINQIGNISFDVRQPVFGLSQDGY
jgi:hypothetical protein